LEETVRELSMSELELVSGGYNTYDLGWTDPVTPPGGGGGDWGWGDWGDWGWGDFIVAGGGGGDNTEAPPDCHAVNEVSIANGVEPPDNAKYYLPESVTQEYLNGALAHLRQFDPITQMDQLLDEFRIMYRDPSHEYFLDFKRWDTAHPGEPNPKVTYWSEAKGEMVTSSAFEAFGNFIYGAYGTMAGIPSEVLRAAAGYTQSGHENILERIGGAIMMADDPMDKPHVDLGITKGDHYNDSGLPIAKAITGNCGS